MTSEQLLQMTEAELKEWARKSNKQAIEEARKDIHWQL